MIFNIIFAYFNTSKHDSAPFKVSKTHALHPRAHHLNINTPAGPRWWHTPSSHRAPSSTRAQHATSAPRRRSSHQHHHTHHATPIVTMCAARPGSARAKCSNRLKIHAAARNLASKRLSRQRRIPLTCAQVRARTFASASGRRGLFPFDRGHTAMPPSGSTAENARAAETPRQRVVTEEKRRSTSRRRRKGSGGRRPRRLAASARHHAASATASCLTGSACVHAAIARAHEI